MRLKGLYMMLSPGADSTKHRTVLDLPGSIVAIVAVGTVDEGVQVARQAVEEGVVLIELCGGFGYAGAQQVSDAVGDRVPVGMVVHQVHNASRLALLFAR